MIKLNKLTKSTMKKVLSKSQMSLIKGGAPTAWLCKAVQSKTETECDVILEGPTEIVMAETAVAAADYMHDKYGASQVNCTKA